jgi:hypothetical protein
LKIAAALHLDITALTGQENEQRCGTQSE